MPNENCSRWHFNFLLLSFIENKTWFFQVNPLLGRGFTWNIKSYFPWKTMKKYLWKLSAAVVIGALRVKEFRGIDTIHLKVNRSSPHQPWYDLYWFIFKPIICPIHAIPMIRLALIKKWLFYNERAWTTLKRNRNATLFQWKMYWVLFKVIDGNSEPSSFEEMLMNSTKQCLKWLPIKKKRITIKVTSVSTYVNFRYF